MKNDLPTLLDERELDDLRARYGEFARRHVRVAMQGESLENYRRQLQRRRGEILLVLSRPTGEVLLHTKHFYPPGIYRLPTGGIHWDEPVVEAWHRELREETQFAAASERLLSVISYEFTGPGSSNGPSVPFVSYVFHQGGLTGTPEPLDESEGISHFRWSPRGELADVAAALRDLDRQHPDQGDWGRFRAVAHEFVHAAKW